MRTLAACLATLLLQACATTPAPFDGVYSNVSYHTETGDLGGAEMEVRLSSDGPQVIFTRCEGGCYGGKTWPSTITGDTIAFTVIDDWFDGEGKLADRTTTRYFGQLRGNALILTSPDHVTGSEKLRRVPDPVPGHTEELATFG